MTSLALAQCPSAMQTPGPPHSVSFAHLRQVLTAAAALVAVSSQIGVVVVPPALVQSPFATQATHVPG
jgi:hypothetical protein